MARFVSESVQSNERVLIVNNGMPALASHLKRVFEEYGSAVQITPALPPHHHRFHRIFLLNVELKRTEIMNPRSHVTELLLLPQQKHPKRSSGSRQIRRVCVSQDVMNEEQLQKLLWYSLSDDSSPFLDLRTNVFHRPHVRPPTRTTPRISPRSLSGIIALCCIVAVVLGFLIPLIIATQINTRLLIQTVQRNRSQDLTDESTAHTLTQTAQTLYIPARPLYSLFSISLFADNYLRFNVASHNYFSQRRQLAREGQWISTWIQNPARANATTLQMDLETLGSSYLALSKVIDEMRATLPANENAKTLDTALLHESATAKKIVQAIPLMKGFLGLTGEQSILVIVTDSNRLRGIGGTIQSIGTVSGSGQSGWQSHFYNSQELIAPADIEQLSSILTTFAPAEATVLQDSSLSVDLYDLKDKLLARIPQLASVPKPTITILLTTPGVQTLLSSFPDITVQGDTFSSTNFGIKQQLYANQSLLIPLLFRQLFDTLGTVSTEQLLNDMITLFDEKQGAILTTNSALQQQLDQLYWSGKTISPSCVNAQIPCINDYLFTADQDLSNRTTSSYVQKQVHKSVRMSDKKNVSSTVSVRWNNTSPLPTEQGGIYRVYTQLLLPGNAQIQQITKNETVLEHYDSLHGKFLILGLYHEVEPGRTSTISVTYTIPKKLKQRTHYQLITQKQLGSPSLPMSVTIGAPTTYTVTSTNIDQVVNNSTITYNTILNTDKLFFVETQKK